VCNLNFQDICADIRYSRLNLPAARELDDSDLAKAKEGWKLIHLSPLSLFWLIFMRKVGEGQTCPSLSDPSTPFEIVNYYVFMRNL
jgi:hypothetical protein